MTSFPKKSGRPGVPIGPSLKVVGLFFGIALASELGLRFNSGTRDRKPFHPTNNEQITLAAFGDSIIARFPTLLADKLNSKSKTKGHDRRPPVTVVNTFKPSAKSDEYPSALKQTLTTHKPDILLITLPGNEYTVRSYDQSFPQSLVRSRSLLVRALYLLVSPKIQKLIDFIHPKTISQDRIASLSKELIYRACCGQLGVETADHLLAEIEYASDLQKQSFEFLSAQYALALLKGDSAGLDRALSSIRIFFSLRPASARAAGIPSIEELEAFAWLKLDNTAPAIDRLQKRLSEKSISELGCLSLIRGVWRAEAEVEGLTIKACNRLFDRSDRIAYHQIDYYIRHNRHQQIAAFAKLLPFRIPTDRNARAAIHGVLGQYLYQEKKISDAKFHLEKAILLNNRNNIPYHWYSAVLNELQKQQHPLTIPKNVADQLLQREDFRNLKFVTSLPLPLPPNFENLSVIFLPPESSTISSFTRRIDYPVEYFTIFDSICTAGVTTIVLNLPLQRIEPIQESLQRVRCLHYVDTRNALKVASEKRGLSNDQLMQEDGFHLSLLGDQIVAEAICNKLKVISPMTFGDIDCAAQSTP